MTQGGPLVFGRERLPHAKRSRKLPVGGLRPSGRMVPHDLLETPPHHFSETEFILAGETFRLVIQMVRDLNLCFYHDGILPSCDVPGNGPRKSLVVGDDSVNASRALVEGSGLPMPLSPDVRYGPPGLRSLPASFAFGILPALAAKAGSRGHGQPLTDRSAFDELTPRS